MYGDTNLLDIQKLYKNHPIKLVLACIITLDTPSVRIYLKSAYRKGKKKQKKNKPQVSEITLTR